MIVMLLALCAAAQVNLNEIRNLRELPDSKRGAATRDLALRIRALPKSDNKIKLATRLAYLSTEGDFGKPVLQEVAATLAVALSEKKAASAAPYSTLAQLVRYEGVSAKVENSEFAKAMADLEADDKRRAAADFSLRDLTGREWKLSALRGKVVLVNFWATWCPPCRKEIPDLSSLYSQFENKGFVVLAISDEERAKVEPFVRDQRMKYPVLLDAGRKVTEQFAVDGIPKSFVYDREGRLAATAIDMRTRGQFLAMLAKAGLQ